MKCLVAKLKQRIAFFLLKFLTCFENRFFCRANLFEIVLNWFLNCIWILISNLNCFNVKKLILIYVLIKFFFAEFRFFFFHKPKKLKKTCHRSHLSSATMTTILQQNTGAIHKKGYPKPDRRGPVAKVSFSRCQHTHIYANFTGLILNLSKIVAARRATWSAARNSARSATYARSGPRSGHSYHAPRKHCRWNCADKRLSSVTHSLKITLSCSQMWRRVACVWCV